MATVAPQPAVTIERIERALVLAAHVVMLDGEVYLPLFNRLENELQSARRQADAMSRARTLLESYTSSGALKAIR